MADESEVALKQARGAKNQHCVVCHFDKVLYEQLYRGKFCYALHHYHPYEACSFHSDDELSTTARKIRIRCRAVGTLECESFSTFVSRKTKLITGNETDALRRFLPSKLPSSATIHAVRAPMSDENVLLSWTVELAEVSTRLDVASSSLEHAWDALYLLNGEADHVCRELIHDSVRGAALTARKLLELVDKALKKKDEKEEEQDKSVPS